MNLTQTLKKLIPFIGFYYAGLSLFFFGKSLFTENSYITYLFRNLTEFRFLTLINASMLSSLISPVIGLILLYGLYRYFTRKGKFFSRPILLGISFFTFSYLFFIPARIFVQFIGYTPYPTGLFYQVNSVLSLLMFIVVTWVLIQRNRSLQREAFPPKERLDFGPSLYEKHLEAQSKRLGWKRFHNYLLDQLFTWIMVFPALLTAIQYYKIEIPYQSWQLVFLTSMLFYYVFMEAIAGQTLGKMITGTFVQFQGMTTFGGAFLRTVCRFIPFEPFSFLAHKGYGWHDNFSNTYVEPLGAADQTQSVTPENQIIPVDNGN